MTSRPQGIRTDVQGPDGLITVRSRLEGRVCNDLIVRRIPFEYESVKLKYMIEHTYNPDVILRSTDQSREMLIEVKGYFLASDRTKLRAVRDQNMDIDLRLLFQSAERTLTKKSQTSYANWCQKYGFRFCENRIPESWIRELEGSQLQ